jgi:hypothetical protein
MLEKPLMPKCWQRRFVVDVKDVGEGPRAEGVDEGDVGVDVKDVSEAPRAEVLAKTSCCSLRRYRRRYVVSVGIKG